MKRISFPAGNRFSAIVCLNANLPSKDIFDILPGVPIIVADGGANYMLEIGVEPDLIIGDMDSFALGPRFDKFEKSKMIIIPDQETNDFEKILLYCLRKGLPDLLILGFHGGELEHTLNNWSVFKKFSQRLNMCIFDENRYGISIREPIDILLNCNEIISLIPQPRAILSTENLEWKLDNELLELGLREGARNVVIGEKVTIDLHEGQILMFINNRLPIPPKFTEHS